MPRLVFPRRSGSDAQRLAAPEPSRPRRPARWLSVARRRRLGRCARSGGRARGCGSRDVLHRGRRGRRRRRRRRSDPSAGIAGRLRRTGIRSRQEEQRVEVSVFLGGPADPEIDVGHVHLRDAARPDGSDRISLLHRFPAPHPEGAEVHERDRVPVRSLDRDGLAPARHGAGERHCARSWSDDRSPGGGADVDPAVLAARVGMPWIERERGQHGPGHRPGPAERRGRDDQGGGGDKNEQAHRGRPPLSGMQTPLTVARPAFVVKSGYSDAS